MNSFENKNETYISFYISDLIKSNIIYRLNSEHYKYKDKLINFDYQYTKEEEKIKEIIESRFPQMVVCIWSTNFLSNFMNLQPYAFYTFIEVNYFYKDIVYDYLKNTYNNILINPSKKELYYYTKEEKTIIIRKLSTGSPLGRPYRNIFGPYHNTRSSQSNSFKQTIEKTIVDIFADREIIELYSEHKLIIRSLLEIYSVNFKKLLSYAHYRGVKNEIGTYLSEIINYNVEKGEFYD
jgi:hypothetical protein